jgi:hypothetical protein
MQRYINQIIADFKKAKQNVPPDPELEKAESDEVFAEKMLALETAPSVSFKEFFNVAYEELPPPEKLSEDQMKQIIDAIVDTFKAFHISVDLKPTIPLKLKYEILRDIFIDEIFYMPGFDMTFDFCDGNCNTCKIFDYCELQDKYFYEKDRKL